MFFQKYRRQIYQAVKSTKLRSEARALGKEKLLAKMQAQPVRNSPITRLQYQNSRSPFLFLKIRPMFAALALMVTLALGGGAYAAEGTVPGDALYPVKLAVNENVRARLSLSEEGKAHWDARVVERRLEEAAKLSAKGELKGEVEARITENFTKQSDKLREKIANLQAEGKADEAARLASRLEASLTVQEQILARFSASTTTSSVNMPTSTRPFPLLESVRLRVQEAKKGRVEAEHGVTTTLRMGVETAATNRLREAKKKVATASDYVESQAKVSNVDTEAIVKARGEVVVAKELLIKAEAALNAQNFSESFAFSSQAHRIAEQIRKILRANSKIEGGVEMKKMFEDNQKRRDEEGRKDKDGISESELSNKTRLLQKMDEVRERVESEVRNR